MISPTLLAVALATLTVAAHATGRLRFGRLPKRRHRDVLGTAIAGVAATAIVAILEFTGSFRSALGDPSTPALVVAAVVVLQVAVVLGILVIRRRSGLRHSGMR